MEKIHGKQSIRFDNPGGDVIELVSREYKLIPGRVYTFSWYMKSSEPVDIRAGQYAGEMVTPTFSDWSMFTARNFRTSTQWKRPLHHLHGKRKTELVFHVLPLGSEGETLLGKCLVRRTSNPGGEGSSPLCAIRSRRRSGLRRPPGPFPGETLPCELRLVNYTDRPRPIHARLEIRDTLMPEIPFPGRTISQTVPPNGTLTSSARHRNPAFRSFPSFRASGRRRFPSQGLGDWFLHRNSPSAEPAYQSEKGVCHRHKTAISAFRSRDNSERLPDHERRRGSGIRGISQTLRSRLFSVFTTVDCNGSSWNRNREISTGHSPTTAFSLPAETDSP